MSGAVVVVGSVNADLVVSVRELPQAGETVTGGTFAATVAARARTRP